MAWPPTGGSPSWSLDYAVAADSIDPNRVNVFEVLTSFEALVTFRDDGPDGEIASLIERAEVAEYEASDRKVDH